MSNSRFWIDRVRFIFKSLAHGLGGGGVTYLLHAFEMSCFPGYGLTESGSSLMELPSSGFEYKAKAAGVPLPNTACKASKTTAPCR